MGRLSQEERLLLDALIKENGADKVKDYISRTFTPTVIKIRRITPENAHEWMDLRAFAAWLVDDCQQRLRGSTPPRDPAPPVVEQQRPPDVQQPPPTEVQQPRNPEMHQPRPSVDEVRESMPQRPPDVEQPRPTEVQQPRTPEVQQPRHSVEQVRQPRPTEVQSTASPPFPPPSTSRPLQKRVRLLDLEDAAAHPDSDDPLATGPSDALNRKRRHTSLFDEVGSAQASGSNPFVGPSPFTGHSGSSQDTDRPFDVPCSYCKERGIPCMPQKDVYRAMACLLCSCARVHCSHVPPSRSGKPANRYPPALCYVGWPTDGMERGPPPANASNMRVDSIFRRFEAQRAFSGGRRRTRQSDEGREKVVSSGPWLSNMGDIRKIKINGKVVEVAKKR